MWDEAGSTSMDNLITKFEKTNELRKRAHALIPGGAHTYAKGDDQFPVLSPSHIVRGHGCHAWDADGNRYIEYGMGNRAVSLGHGYAPVIEALKAELSGGCNFSRPAAIEVAAAEQFLSVIDNADMVKFSKDGSDATTGATRIARAYTGRDLIAICAEQPFFSVDDWFIGATAMHGGIPDVVRNLTVKFSYNNIESVKALLAKHPGQISCFILEPSRIDPPKDNFLQELKRLVHADGGLLIFDEMISGFRWHLKGAQHVYGVDPDLSTWGKAMANGFACSALTGKREYMRLGDIDQPDKPRAFLLSTTHGGETHTLAAMMATLQVYKTEPVIEHMHRVGERLRTGLTQVARRHGVQDHFQVIGNPASLLYTTTDHEKKPSQPFRTLLLQEAIKRGVIMASLVVSYSHQDTDIDQTIDALDGALGVYAKALSEGSTDKFLVGRPSVPVYRLYNPKLV